MGRGAAVRAVAVGVLAMFLSGCLVPPGIYVQTPASVEAGLRQSYETEKRFLQIAARPGGVRRVVISEPTDHTDETWRTAEPGDILFEWPVTPEGCATLVDEPGAASVWLPGPTASSFVPAAVLYGRAGDQLWAARIDGDIVYCGKSRKRFEFDPQFGCYHDMDADGDFDRVFAEADWMSGHQFLFHSFLVGWSDPGEIDEPRYQVDETCVSSEAGTVRAQFSRFVPVPDGTEAQEVEFGIGFSETAETLGPVHRFATFDADGQGVAELIPGLPDLVFRKAGAGTIEVKLSGRAEGEVVYWLPERDDDNLKRSIDLDFPPFSDLLEQTEGSVD